MVADTMETDTGYILPLSNAHLDALLETIESIPEDNPRYIRDLADNWRDQFDTHGVVFLNQYEAQMKWEMFFTAYEETVTQMDEEIEAKVNEIDAAIRDANPIQLPTHLFTENKHAISDSEIEDLELFDRE